MKHAEVVGIKKITMVDNNGVWKILTPNAEMGLLLESETLGWKYKTQVQMTFIADAVECLPFGKNPYANICNNPN